MLFPRHAGLGELPVRLPLAGASRVQTATSLRRIGANQRLADQARLLVYINTCLRDLISVTPPASLYPGEGFPSCPRPTPPSCKNCLSSTGLHPGSTVDSAMRYMGRNTNDLSPTFRAMIWCGLLIIWTRCAITCPFPAFHSSHVRLLSASNLRAPLPASVYVNSEAYAVPRGYCRHHTRFPLTSYGPVPIHSPQEVTVMCTKGPSVIRWSVSNGCGCMPKTAHRRLPKCVLPPSLLLLVITVQIRRRFVKRL